MKNKFLNNSKFWNVMEKAVPILIIVLLILSTSLVGSIHALKNTKSNIRRRNICLSNLKDNIKQLENHDNSLGNLSWLDFNTWITHCASPSNILIYNKTSNLNLLSEKSQKELDTISKNFKVIENGMDYSRLVKFVIINKEKKTFITNDVDNIEIIKKNLSEFSEENGKFYNYISNKGRWYNLSYDSTSAPAHNNDSEHHLSEPWNFVEAYWFPGDYKYSREDDVLLNDLFNYSKKNYYLDIDSENNLINDLKNQLTKQYIFIAVHSILIIILLMIFYFLGKERIIKGIKNSLVCRMKRAIDNWVQRKSTFFKINFYALYTTALVLMFVCFIIGFSVNSIIFAVGIVFVPLVFIFFIFTLPKIFKFCKYLDEIISGSDKITSGDINHIIKETGDVRLVNLAHNINKINKGFKVSIEDQIKNEKLKSQLVANVSHDLKTPLTSIINSTDILLREEISEEEKREYLNILYRKSLKLKKLIDDLFQISKINSGKVQLNKSNVDVLELVNQSIAEYSDTEIYNDKNLNFIIRPFKENINMNLDGNKMSRVFENIINNTLKYSLKDTRVYVDIEDMVDGIRVSFKNISSAPLNFDKEEIFERFTRGDKSRNSNIDGNGLGLAIAKSIVELHGGNMYVDFDGDLFKSIIELKFCY